MTNNGAASGGQHGNDDEAMTDDFDPGEYGEMMLLERLESLEEDMEELGVTTLDQVRQRIAELHQQLDAAE